MRRAALLLAALAFVQCASLVAVEDEEDAVEKLCVCQQLLNDTVFDDAAQCRVSVSSKLDNALSSARADWLARFNELNCGESCSNALDCYQTPPTCQPSNLDCDTDEECCSGNCIDGSDGTICE